MNPSLINKQSIKRKALVNGTILTDGQMIEGAVVTIEDQTITNVLHQFIQEEATEIIDLNGAFICPGFIDLQIMGAGGELFGGNPSVEGLKTMETQLLKQGVVGFLPTVSTNAQEVINTALSAAIEYRPHALGNFLGLHLEGPYIQTDYRGAHPADYIRVATIEEIKDLLQMASGELKMITLAPELQDPEVLLYLETENVITAMGHTGANYKEAGNFLSGTRKAVTHLFNGMPAMHHRKPGPIPAIFEKKPYTSIVADGIHVDYAMIALAKQILGEFLYLISDAATPCVKGTYQHTDSGDRYTTTDSSGHPVLSGSKLTMISAIKNSVDHAGMTLAEAVNMATLYPARLMRMSHQLGSVKSGYQASMVVFDRDFIIRKVFFNGNMILNQE